MKEKKRTAIFAITFLIIDAILYYLFLPAINIHSSGFYASLLIVVIEVIITFADANVRVVKSKNHLELATDDEFENIMKVIGIFIAIFVISMVVFSPLFNAKGYAQRITVESVEFSEVPEYSFKETAIIDRDSASLLGDKVMGQMSDLVSQFTVSSEYSQISYQNQTVRATPLAYDGFIKYLRNRSEGVPGYIIVNTTSGNTTLKRLTEKMIYVPSAYFNENLYRKLRFQYPFEIFNSPTFEIDEDGNPYYVCTTYTYTGLHSKRRVSGVILFNPVDGTSQKYALDEVPSWVDHIYPESLVNVELEDYGKYRSGFWNSIIGQEGVMKPSSGYNYISKDGDIWLYTGMTSAASDDSNLGFMLVNLRTHEAQYIASSGASETAVMASAEGEVLNYGYTATFPTLINISNQPVYLLSLKDSAGLIKMYAMVDAQDYQQVYTVKADKDTETAIASLISQVFGGNSTVSGNQATITFEISEIQKADISGTTYLFLKDQDGNVYKLEINLSNADVALFLHDSDTVEITYDEMSQMIVDLQVE